MDRSLNLLLGVVGRSGCCGTWSVAWERSHLGVGGVVNNSLKQKPQKTTNETKAKPKFLNTNLNVKTLIAIKTLPLAGRATFTPSTNLNANLNSKRNSLTHPSRVYFDIFVFFVEKCSIQVVLVGCAFVQGGLVWRREVLLALLSKRSGFNER